MSLAMNLNDEQQVAGLFRELDDLSRENERLRIHLRELLPETDALAAGILEVCKLRGWSLHWTHRGAYLHLEASELIEAIRGKRGDPLSEAGDVLLVLMSITENAGIPFSAVVQQARETAEALRIKPHYEGEEFSTSITENLSVEIKEK